MLLHSHLIKISLGFSVMNVVCVRCHLELMGAICYWKVAAKDSLKFGDRIFLPISIQESPSRKEKCPCTEEEVEFIQSLELYKVLNFNSSMVGVSLTHFCLITPYGFPNIGFSHYRYQ